MEFLKGDGGEGKVDGNLRKKPYYKVHFQKAMQLFRWVRGQFLDQSYCLLPGTCYNSLLNGISEASLVHLQPVLHQNPEQSFQHLNLWLKNLQLFSKFEDQNPPGTTKPWMLTLLLNLSTLSLQFSAQASLPWPCLSSRPMQMSFSY